MDSDDEELDGSGFWESHTDELEAFCSVCSDDVAENHTVSEASSSVALSTSSSVALEPAAASDAGGPSRWRTELNTHKAGMQGLDKEHVNRVIYEASKNSLYYQNEMKKEKVVEERVARQQQELSRIGPSVKRMAKQQADKYIEYAESKRDLDRLVVHIDMDAFYAAVEILHQPELAEKPMAVGGMGMLSTSNYAARKFGVRAGMPGFIGKKLCPDLILVKSHFDRYRVASQKVREILALYDPDFEAVGLDESYLDMTDYVQERSESAQAWQHHTVTIPLPPKCSGAKKFVVGDVTGDVAMACPLHANRALSTYDKDWGECQSCTSATQHTSTIPLSCSESEHSSSDGDVIKTIPESPVSSPCNESTTDGCDREQPVSGIGGGQPTVAFGNSLADVLREMTFRIHQHTGLTASVGVASNRRLAKICSDRNKPNGIYLLPNDRDAILTFMQQLPIRKVNGIGKVSERLLKAMDISSCGELYEKRDVMWAVHTPGTAQHYTDISLGLGSSYVSSAEDYQSKSVSVERTFRELSRPEDLMAKCRELCESLAEDLEKDKVEGKTVTLKLKEVTFRVRSRAVSLALPVSSADALFSAASSSLRSELAASKITLRLRLMGVRLSALQRVEKKQQMSLTRFLSTAVATTSAQTGKTDIHGGAADASATMTTSVASGPGSRNGVAGACSSPQATSERMLSVKSQTASTSEAERLCSTELESDRAPVGMESSSSAATDDLGAASDRAGLQCPVCMHTLLDVDNSQFNQHVDDCLSRGTVRDLMSRQSATSSAGSHSSTQRSQTQSSSSLKATKGIKRHGSTSSQQPKKKAVNATQTLHSLWSTAKKASS